MQREDLVDLYWSAAACEVTSAMIALATISLTEKARQILEKRV
ncbi:MAG: hypothetical protein O6826_10360 [Acidobacteria bacterium]|nr:hypothetical protein [Acidobacteriota bacterium]MCZ6769041.1 hypothetical protein [Acidobacteriota bacterium]